MRLTSDTRNVDNRPSEYTTGLEEETRLLRQRLKQVEEENSRLVQQVYMLQNALETQR